MHGSNSCVETLPPESVLSPFPVDSQQTSARPPGRSPADPERPVRSWLPRRRNQPMDTVQMTSRSRGSRSRPETARHVHRFHRGTRPAPPDLGSRRQCCRRGDGGYATQGRRADSRRRRRRGPDNGRGIPVEMHVGRHPHRRRRDDRPARRGQVPKRAPTRSPAVCTASAYRWSTRCPHVSKPTSRDGYEWFQTYDHSVPGVPSSG